MNFFQNSLQEINSSAALCKDGSIAPYIDSPDDFACIVELRKLNAADTPDELIQNITKVNSIINSTRNFFLHFTIL